MLVFRANAYIRGRRVRHSTVGASPAGARRLRGVARVPHPRQPRLPARLPHPAVRGLRAAIPRAHPAPAQPGPPPGPPASHLPGRTALPLVRPHDGIPGRVPGAAEDLLRVAGGVGAAAARAEPRGVVPGVLAAAHPPPPHARQPLPASHLDHLAVEPRGAQLPPYM